MADKFLELTETELRLGFQILLSIHAFGGVEMKGNDFIDVTLACDDEYVAAHKFVLVACSSFFASQLECGLKIRLDSF